VGLCFSARNTQKSTCCCVLIFERCFWERGHLFLPLLENAVVFGEKMLYHLLCGTAPPLPCHLLRGSWTVGSPISQGWYFIVLHMRFVSFRTDLTLGWASLEGLQQLGEIPFAKTTGGPPRRRGGEALREGAGPLPTAFVGKSKKIYIFSSIPYPPGIRKN